MAVPGITVIDVFHEMRVEADKEATWAVGQMAVQHYRKTYGELPPKDLRPKTCGVGVHCFAIYPESYRDTIKEFIRKVGAQSVRQGELI